MFKFNNNKTTMNLTNEYKATVCAESYLGLKGYTIPKSVLTAQDIAFLKKDLFLKPQTPGPSFGPAADDAFPVYRENDKKMYIPRFYGIERYGHPPRSEIAPGMDIDVSFPRELRDYQNKIVDIYMRGFHPPHAPRNDDNLNCQSENAGTVSFAGVATSSLAPRTPPLAIVLQQKFILWKEGACGETMGFPHQGYWKFIVVPENVSV